MVTRDEIIKEGRTWLDTPFQHQGRLKGAGVDCIGVLSGVAKVLGLTNHDAPAYPRYPQGGELMPELEKALERIEVEDARPGDVMVFWINARTKIPQHLALLTDYGLLHTNPNFGKVVEHGFTKKWRRRLFAAFRFPGVGDD